MKQSKRHLVFQLVLFLMIVVLVALTILAKLNNYFLFDLIITRMVQQFDPSWFDSLMRVVTLAGETTIGGIIMLMVCSVLFYFGYRKEAIFTFLSTSGIYLIGSLVKSLVARPRPDPALVNQLTAFTKHDSFPSGHVLFFMAFLGFLTFLVFIKFKAGWLKNFLISCLVGLVVLAGFSRIYLGAHWFSDVLASYLLGTIWLLLLVRLYRNY